MLHFVHGDIFNSPAHTLVNPVNCVGVMGKGLALKFKKRFPNEFIAYKKLCDDHSLTPQRWFYITNGNDKGKEIIAAPTKRHWIDNSNLKDLNIVLQRIALECINHADIVKSIAIPKLGCGCGGLDWESQVRPLVQRYFDIPEIKIDVYVYES